ARAGAIVRAVDGETVLATELEVPGFHLLPGLRDRRLGLAADPGLGRGRVGIAGRRPFRAAAAGGKHRGQGEDGAGACKGADVHCRSPVVLGTQPSSRQRRRRIASSSISTPATAPIHSAGWSRWEYTAGGETNGRMPRRSMAAPSIRAKSCEVSGTVPSSIRATMLVQNQLVSRLNSRITLNRLTNTPDRIGTSSAHRNGTLRAQAEHSISQPTVGSAQSAYTGIAASIDSEIISGLPGPQISSQGFPPCIITTALSISRKPNIVAMADSVASTGRGPTPLTTLEATVMPSDTGIDFQNSTLRSLRSSYRAPRQ